MCQHRASEHVFNPPELHEVLLCFKRSTIIQVSRKPSMAGRNHHRPVPPTPVASRSFQRRVLNYLENSTGPVWKQQERSRCTLTPP